MMRRKDREVASPEEIEAIVSACRVLRLAMADGDVPYIVPLNFGYSRCGADYRFYFHCAGEGRKLDMLRRNSRVCLEMDTEYGLIFGETPCAYGYRYSSVIADGVVRELTDPSEKATGLSAIMRQQTGGTFSFTEQQTDGVTVCEIRVTELSAKRRC